MQRVVLYTLAIISTGLFLYSVGSQVTLADQIDDLKNKIHTRASDIQRLEQEIAEYQDQIYDTQKKAKTLSNSIYELDLTRKKLQADISITQNQIEQTNYEIQELQTAINRTARKIDSDYALIASIMRNINESDNQSLVEVILSNNELSDFWNNVESMERFRQVIGENLDNLEILHAELEEAKRREEQEKRDYIAYEKQLDDQKEVVEINKSSKNSLLRKTKNEEGEYQRILSEKKAAKDAFEAELANFEAQLKMVIDQGKLPEPGSAALWWPLDSVYVTQYFGNTDFARSGAYSGKGHNGVDFRAAVGTPVKSGASGVVQGVGNTDAYPGCYSYGKWVLVKHDNGLTTMNAHLSLIKVTEGQRVSMGDLLGYSGNTGYSTGPHLHFGVYASEGVQIVRLGDTKSRTNCADARIPVAPFNAYLNPIDYLPQ